MVARPKGDGRRCYVCASGVDFLGCGKIRQLSEPLEEFVRDAVFGVVAGPGFAKALRSEDQGDREFEILEALRVDEEALEELARDHYVRRLISKVEFLAVREDLERRVEGHRRELGRVSSSQVLATLPSGLGALEAAWEDGEVSWRKALVRVVLEAVVLHPAVMGRNFFDPSRVELVWRV